MSDSIARPFSIVNTPLSTLSPAPVRKGKASMITRTPTYAPELHKLIAEVQHYFYMPDPTPLLVLLASTVANLMTDGPPIWLMYVGPPSSGKSDLLYLVSSLESIVMVATFTEPALLSGTDPKGRTKTSTGGILEEIGGRGILVAKDFTSIISLPWEQRNRILAALREIYDGRWMRHLGLNSGQTLSWEGKLGFLGGVTEVIDTCHPIISALGDRFTYCRMSNISSDQIADMVLARDNSNNAQMRDRLRVHTCKFIDDICDQSWEEIPLVDVEKEWLKAAARISAVGRTAVIRHPTKRDIEDVMEPESIGRLLASAGQLHAGLQRIGCSYAESIRVVSITAMNCIPKKRARLVGMLEASGGGLCAEEMCQGDQISYPGTVIYRILEDMEYLGMVRKEGTGRKKDVYKWYLTATFLNNMNILQSK